MFKGFIEFKDGEKIATTYKNTQDEVIRELKEKTEQTTRYFKKDNMTFGISGKLFTLKEEHGGIKNAYIKEYKLINTIKIDLT